MIELLTALAARQQHGRFILRGERLIVVDGAVWGRTRPIRAGGITEHRVYAYGSNEPLKGSARDYDALRRLVEDRMNDGSLPAAVEAGRALRAVAYSTYRVEKAARKAAEEGEWRLRATRAVGNEVAGHLSPAELQELVERILDAMKWAKTR